MKKIVFITMLLMFLFSGIVFSRYQIADIYICEEGMVLAELSAKSIVSRKELYRASYCSCEGVDPSLKTEVQKGVWKKMGIEIKYGACEAPKDRVFHCVCVGQDHY